MPLHHQVGLPHRRAHQASHLFPYHCRSRVHRGSTTCVVRPQLPCAPQRRTALRRGLNCRRCVSPTRIKLVRQRTTSVSWSRMHRQSILRRTVAGFERIVAGCSEEVSTELHVDESLVQDYRKFTEHFCSWIFLRNHSCSLLAYPELIILL